MTWRNHFKTDNGLNDILDEDSGCEMFIDEKIKFKSQQKIQLYIEPTPISAKQNSAREKQPS